MCKAKALSGYAFGRDKLIPAFSSSDISVYPHQVASAMFALRSPFLPGVVLCDEGGLGKSYVALLIILQKWFAGRQRALFVIPAHLRAQWQRTLDEKISVPAMFLDSAAWNEALKNGQANPFEQDAIVVTTYEFTVQHAEEVAAITWDAAMFDEAHRLSKCHEDSAKEAQTLKRAVGSAFKILLTATPIQLNIMDLFGLIHFIDDSAFPDARLFYERYFRKPENYPELAAHARKYCFRTLRSQVKSYAKIPERLPITVEFQYSKEEKHLAALIEDYLRRPVKAAFPKMERYDLALVLYKALSSSPAALAQTLSGVVKRLEDGDELEQIREMLAAAEAITEPSKAKALLQCLDVCFRELKKRGAAKKALIFTESRATQQYLKETLQSKYKVITYSGDNRDSDIITAFRDTADILIATDLASDGLNFEFCALAVHYDLAYNTLKMEQRIDRCHRLNQQNDVVSLSLLCRENFADVRTLELVGKRTLLADGVFGLSDDVIGGFVKGPEGLPALLERARPRADIEAAFNNTLVANAEPNQAAVQSAEDMLFTTFTKSAAEGVYITPQYVKEKVRAINDDVWDVLRWFFGRYAGFAIDESTRSICAYHDPAPSVFTGTRLGRSEYSADKSYPKAGRITIGCPMVQNVLREIAWQGLPRAGTLTVGGDLPPCEIAFYEIKVNNGGFGGGAYTVFAGRERGGRTLTDKECRDIMALSVVNFTVHGEPVGQRNAHLLPEPAPHPLDGLVDVDVYIKRYAEESDPAVAEEVQRLRLLTEDKKAALERSLSELRRGLTMPGSAASVSEKILAEKRRAVLERELKLKEQSLFMDAMRLDVALEEKIREIAEQARLKAAVTRLFLITVTGGNFVG